MSGFRAGETSSKTHLPTTSASAYCCGNFDRRKFKTDSVDKARLAKCATLFFETDDGRTFAGADASIL